MKTSTLLLIGVAAYLYYHYSQSQTSAPVQGPVLQQGPPLPINDVCNGVSAYYDAVACAFQGRQPYYPLD